MMVSVAYSTRCTAQSRGLASGLRRLDRSKVAKGRDWRVPWHRRRDAGAAPALSVNVTSRRSYRCVNTLALWAACVATRPACGAYRQWAELSGQVRKGERAATVVFWRLPDAAQQDEGASCDEDGEEGDEGVRRYPWVRAYAVFNAVEVDGAAGGGPPREAGIWRSAVIAASLTSHAVSRTYPNHDIRPSAVRHALAALAHLRPFTEVE
jgi:hypothetical protein